jgi:hypothetical protein
MTLPATFLTGRRGWTAVASLSALLGALLVGQLPAQAGTPPAPAPTVAPAAVIELPASRARPSRHPSRRP